MCLSVTALTEPTQDLDQTKVIHNSHKTAYDPRRQSEMVAFFLFEKNKKKFSRGVGRIYIKNLTTTARSVAQKIMVMQNHHPESVSTFLKFFAQQIFYSTGPFWAINYSLVCCSGKFHLSGPVYHESIQSGGFCIISHMLHPLLITYSIVNISMASATTAIACFACSSNILYI